MAFDEARFGLINWHNRRYCPRGFLSPYAVRRAYEWISRQRGEFVRLPLPSVDGGCFEAFLEHVGEAYSEHHLVAVLDGVPSHRSKEIALPRKVSLLPLPRCSPEF